ncbi:hypothetical protein V1514DRAFT_296356 [Lipomyces japonicus]|uniref:uncharacterized protein n=1 Tax=Lipomyces japonicus TaxID=56871 RepID=UPI0034CE038B
MGVLGIFSSSVPYHLYGYSLLFGSTIYQSFFVGITAFKALPRNQFSALQRKIFPPYFAMQTVLPVFLALTAPFPIKNDGFSIVVLAVSAITSLINLVVIGPRTVKIMGRRHAQEVKEDKKYYDEGVSQDMKKLNKEFGTIHGASTILNLAGLFTTAAYGAVLASKLAN